MKKRLFTLLMAVIMIFSLSVPSFAYVEYDRFYDETGIFDGDEFKALGMEIMPAFEEKYNIELRVDIIKTIGDYADVVEAAQGIYQKQSYGHGEGKNGVTLTVYMKENGDTYDMVDFYVYAGGDSSELTTNGPMNGFYGAEPFLTEEVWNNITTDEQRTETMFDAVKGFIIGMEDFVLAGGVAGSIYNPMEQNQETSSQQNESSQSEINSQTASDTQQSEQAGDLYFVTDAAGILTEEQCAELEAMAERAEADYQFGMYIIIMEDFTEYTQSGDPYEAAKELYEKYNLGYGDDKSGLLLMLSMSERDYAIIAHGFGNTAFTDFGKDKLSGEFLPHFGDDDWYGGFYKYMSVGIDYLKSAREGLPIDVAVKNENRTTKMILGFAVCAAIGFFASAFIVSVIETEMHSVRLGVTAGDYVVSGSLNIKDGWEKYTHTTEDRTLIKSESSSSGGSSGGTSVDSDGYSGSSGKF